MVTTITKSFLLRTRRFTEGVHVLYCRHPVIPLDIELGDPSSVRYLLPSSSPVCRETQDSPDTTTTVTKTSDSLGQGPGRLPCTLSHSRYHYRCPAHPGWSLKTLFTSPRSPPLKTRRGRGFLVRVHNPSPHPLSQTEPSEREWCGGSGHHT